MSRYLPSELLKYLETPGRPKPFDYPERVMELARCGYYRALLNQVARSKQRFEIMVPQQAEEVARIFVALPVFNHRVAAAVLRTFYFAEITGGLSQAALKECIAYYHIPAALCLAGSSLSSLLSPELFVGKYIPPGFVEALTHSRKMIEIQKLLPWCLPATYEASGYFDEAVLDIANALAAGNYRLAKHIKAKWEPGDVSEDLVECWTLSDLKPSREALEKAVEWGWISVDQMESLQA